VVFDIMALATDPVNIDGSGTGAWAAVVKDPAGNPVPQISQEQTEWCWAACAQMVLQFYGNSSVQQCDLASKLFGEPCCANPDSPLCNEPAQVPDLAGVYAQWGRNAVLVPGDVPFETLQSEINANRPIEIGFIWNDGTGHQVLVCGWNIDGTGPYLLVNDPKWGSGAVYYSNLQAAYGWGSWKWTWQSIS
jgi:hypothetical protein